VVAEFERFARSVAAGPPPGESDDFPLTISNPTNSSTVTSPINIVASAQPAHDHRDGRRQSGIHLRNSAERRRFFAGAAERDQQHSESARLAIVRRVAVGTPFHVWLDQVTLTAK